MEKKMAEYVKREGSRENCEIPIIWADYHSGNYRSATICNKSYSGLYLKTQFETKSKSDIFIKPLNYQPNSEGPEAYRFYEAKVKWLKEMPEMDGPYFGVGVQYLAKSHKIYNPTYQCSMCDKQISFGDIHEIDDFVYLCSYCHDNYNSMPNGIIKSNLKNFMLGNVV